MREFPSGTVTFLFTDVEGSTRLLHKLGAEEYAAALAEHRRALRAAFAAHDGVEVDTQGDAFFVAFPTAPGALAAASDLTEALEAGPIRVRVGVHTGSPFLAEEGYVGVDVHRAARIAAAGHGAQVLVSASTAALADGVKLRDLGEHRFKDLTAAERVFQLGEADFPPLKTLFQTNLPVPTTAFLGRERELAEIGALLEQTRLLTLTGPGGSGKTRLALQAGGAAADAYPQGVWWVPLAAIADPAGVVQAVGRALGASGRLAEGIGDRRLLLLLDNFEHVIEASGELSELLADCPNVDLLVTSRERLRIAGEQVYPVPVLARAEARELFATRARALRPDFAVDESVDELCERLDDLPLALELAAARTLMLTGKQLVERLGSRLDLLRGGRDADRRQQTLRATIEWSHDLLEPDEQELFGRLAVFVGGCTLAAAEEICGADLDSLQSLVEKSLVRVRDVGRFWMLETIRELALERLAASGNEATLRDAHAAWFYELALEANLAEDARGSNHRYDLVLPEGANLRAAIDWTDARDEVERALSLVVELENYWITQDVAEGGRRVRGLLARGEISPRLRARAQRLLSGVMSWVNDPDGAAEALSLSLDGFRSLGDEAGVARVLQRSAGLALSRGELEEARRLMSQVQELLPRVRAPRLEAQVPGMLSQIERQSGNPEKALELCLESARKAGEIGFTWWEATHLTLAGEIAAELGRADEAALLFRRALLMHHAIRDRVFTAFVIASFAALAAEGGDADRAGVLWGAFESEERRSPWEWPEERDALERRVRGVPQQAVQRGHALTLDEAVAYALSADSG